MHSKLSIASLFITLGALIAQVSAFHVESGTACSTVGAACSYVSDDSSAGGSKTAQVNGFCASDLRCASNGAKCSTNDNCYNYCGTDGICGGVGAGCNSKDAFSLGQVGITCAAGQTCSENGAVGQCEASDAVAPSSTKAALAANASNHLRRRVRRAAAHLDARQARAADIRKRGF